MPLYFIGLGLGDEKDITVKGLEIVKKCDRLYLEAYTSILGVKKEKLEEFYEKEIIEADRDLVEQEAERILDDSKEMDVAFLVVGDVFGATTHTDLMLRAKKLGIEVQVVHNASIINAVSACGLQLYKFGEVVSIVFFTDSWKPDSFYDKIKSNLDNGLHTLCLLDIKVKEQSIENMLRNRKIYEPPRYMTVNQCVSQLLEIESIRKEGLFSEDSMGCGLARIGQPTQKIVGGTFKQLLEVDFGEPLHSFIVVGDTHFLEDEIFGYYCLPKKDNDDEESNDNNNNNNNDNNKVEKGETEDAEDEVKIDDDKEVDQKEQ
eukprot:TRINITY_DN477_c3_g1_i1.p2 TRINITY_DN477_c3_g1~~TRINITY_DN477_c3_g1_i1.p2  ORF type:complete len:318 (+),score=137.12 TRINITY_DN477_c3_g1_i1:52-1005(+)